MSNKEDYSKLIDKSKYQVFLFNSRANFPFIFAIHPWFVLNKQGEISRWEVAMSDSYPQAQNWGHIYKNLYPFFQGSETFPFVDKLFNESRLLGMVEGENAHKMIDFIQNSSSIYTHRDIYNLLGPNSNTYVQWVIDNFPECKWKLPDNAYGKNYKLK